MDESHFYKNLGSPPHGRGKAPHAAPRDAPGRITPAWAGKRATPRKTGCPGGDHPRMGGEKSSHVASSSVKSGSPPHGRGKGFRPEIPVRITGITPAWAGKSIPNGIVFQLGGDHPRVGGEKFQVSTHDGRFLGSPPHGRGKDGAGAELFQQFRITPAWAGKRPERSISRNNQPDHPRVGGEKAANFRAE